MEKIEKDWKRLEKKWIFFSVVFVVMLAVMLAGIYKWGTGSQAEKINNLNSRLSAESKKAAGWRKTAVKIEADRQKLQSALKEKDAEIVSKAASLEACEKKVAALSKPQVKKSKRAAKKVASAKAAPAPPAIPAVAPAEQGISVPASAPAPQLVVRIVIVEWASVFEGKSLMSRNIGPIVNQGLADGTVVRAKTPYILKVNGQDVTVSGGDTVIDPGPITSGTVLNIRPTDGAKFVSPKAGYSVLTNPGDLKRSLDRGAGEYRITLILAPASSVSEPTSPPAKPAAPIESPSGALTPIFASYILLAAKIGFKINMKNITTKFNKNILTTGVILIFSVMLFCNPVTTSAQYDFGGDYGASYVDYGGYDASYTDYGGSSYVPSIDYGGASYVDYGGYDTSYIDYGSFSEAPSVDYGGVTSAPSIDYGGVYEATSIDYGGYDASYIDYGGFSEAPSIDYGGYDYPPVSYPAAYAYPSVGWGGYGYYGGGYYGGHSYPDVSYGDYDYPSARYPSAVNYPAITYPAITYPTITYPSASIPTAYAYPASYPSNYVSPPAYSPGSYYPSMAYASGYNYPSLSTSPDVAHAAETVASIPTGPENALLLILPAGFILAVIIYLVVFKIRFGKKLTIAAAYRSFTLERRLKKIRERELKPDFNAVQS